MKSCAKRGKTTWGYEAVAIYGGRPGGRVSPAQGSLHKSKAAARAAARGQSVRVKRVRAVVRADCALDYAGYRRK